MAGYSDAFVQVAPDSSGKKVAMLQGVDGQGNTVLFQEAQIVGDAQENLFQIAAYLKQLLAVNRALLALFSDCSNSPRVEEDFVNRDQSDSA